MLTNISVILIASLVIYYSGNKFASASSEIGDYFNLSRSVKGATLDAIASSFPELLIAFFSVVFFHKFDMGIGTIAGSILFNTLIIPSCAVLVSPIVFRVSREVMARDAVFYVISILAFLSAILYSLSWGIAVAVIFIGIYFWYVDMIIEHTKKYQGNYKKMLGDKISVVGKMFLAFFNMIIMGVAAYFLTEHAILLSQTLGVPAVVIGFSIVAMATSIPNIIIAVANAKKGRNDDVMSSVFGSNIFSILIALGIPLLLASVLTGGNIDIVFGGFDLLIWLVVATVVIVYFTIDDYILTKRNAVVMLAMYVGFVGYLIFRSMF
ncbi:hypothetical protein KKG48_00560 [Patescibacteria group bacterium]|nr:hypothetical protein [Patescibacteria group bacterium]MCG2695123.1 hypothetical protein [Candidatus Parcubacteria bacterium]